MVIFAVALGLGAILLLVIGLIVWAYFLPPCRHTRQNVRFDRRNGKYYRYCRDCGVRTREW